MITKPILIILSDLWGEKQSDWIKYYTKYLKKNFEITYYDCCELGALNQEDYTERSLHHQFVNGGIEDAIANLILKEKRAINILAFSIGGFIGWKASLLGLHTQSIFAVSTTRLRLEFEKPNCKIELFYGENDPNKPEDNWFEQLNIRKQIIPNEKHNFYQNKEFARWLSNKIIKTLTPND